MRYTNELLDSLRAEGDPGPDAIVAAIAAHGETGAVNAILKHLVRNDQPVPGELPDEIETWLRDTQALPAIADDERLARAERLFAEHGLQMSFILATASLVWCYAGAKGARASGISVRILRAKLRRQTSLVAIGPVP